MNYISKISALSAGLGTMDVFFDYFVNLTLIAMVISLPVVYWLLLNDR